MICEGYDACAKFTDLSPSPYRMKLCARCSLSLNVSFSLYHHLIHFIWSFKNALIWSSRASLIPENRTFSGHSSASLRHTLYDRRGFVGTKMWLLVRLARVPTDTLPLLCGQRACRKALQTSFKTRLKYWLASSWLFRIHDFLR